MIDKQAPAPAQDTVAQSVPQTDDMLVCFSERFTPLIVGHHAMVSCALYPDNTKTRFW